MIRAHQPGSQPIDIPEVIPNPAVVPKPEPAPREPAPKGPVKVPEKVPARYQTISGTSGLRSPSERGLVRRILDDVVGCAPSERSLLVSAAVLRRPGL